MHLQLRISNSCQIIYWFFFKKGGSIIPILVFQHFETNKYTKSTLHFAFVIVSLWLGPKKSLSWNEHELWVQYIILLEYSQGFNFHLQFGSQYKTKCYPQILRKCKVLRQAIELGLHLCYSCCLWKQIHMRSIPWDLVGSLNSSTSNKSWSLLIVCIFLKVISNMTHLIKYWLECVFLSTRYILFLSCPIAIHEFYLGLSKKKLYIFCVQKILWIIE